MNSKPSNDHNKGLLIEIENYKKEQFEAWCEDNNTTASELVNQFIDSCLLESNLSINNLPVTLKGKNDGIEEKINCMIQKAIYPLQAKIKMLETKLESSSVANSDRSINLSDDSAPELNIQKEEISEQRQYLTRHEVWTILKTTDYGKSNGYDSFLHATAQELQPYNIYYDERLKRYYLKEVEDIIEEETNPQ